MYYNYNKMSTDRKKDLYSVLGVNKDSTQDDIKKAYRKLSLQLHPDRNNNSKESTDKYQEINSAYEVLGDETERMNYDRQGQNIPFFGQTTVEINPADIFNFLNKKKFKKIIFLKYQFTRIK
jgi:curved DNA-binding protein CbpA